MIRVLLSSTHSLDDKRKKRNQQDETTAATTDSLDLEKENDTEHKQRLTEKANWDIGMGLTAVTSVDLSQEYNTISTSLKDFTDSLIK